MRVRPARERPSSPPPSLPARRLRRRTAEARRRAAPASDYCARMVTNSGGLEDRSFNQSSWEGLQQAEDELGIDVDVLVSTNETDLAPERASRPSTPAASSSSPSATSWRTRPPTQAAANPDVHFAIVDEVVDAPNVKPIVFDTAQAAYLAGYLAAGVTQDRQGRARSAAATSRPSPCSWTASSTASPSTTRCTAPRCRRSAGTRPPRTASFTGDFEDINKGKTTTAGLHRPGRRRHPARRRPGRRGRRGAPRSSRGTASHHLGRQRRLRHAAGRSTARSLLTSVLKNTRDAVVEIVGDDIERHLRQHAVHRHARERRRRHRAVPRPRVAGAAPSCRRRSTQLQADIISGTLVVTEPEHPAIAGAEPFRAVCSG